MDKDEVLYRSRLEHQNQDLAAQAVAIRAGNIAGRVGACVCCLLCLVSYGILGKFLYAPWIIYFSILGTHALVTYREYRRKSELALVGLYYLLSAGAFVGFVLRLAGGLG